MPQRNPPSASTPPPRRARGRLAASAPVSASTPPPLTPAAQRMLELVATEKQRVNGNTGMRDAWLSSTDAGAAQLGLADRCDGTSLPPVIRSQATAIVPSVTAMKAVDVEGARRGLSTSEVDRLAIGLTKLGDLNEAGALRRHEQLFAQRNTRAVLLAGGGEQQPETSKPTAVKRAGESSTKATPAPGVMLVEPEAKSTPSRLPPLTAAFAAMVGTTSAAGRKDVEGAAKPGSASSSKAGTPKRRTRKRRSPASRGTDRYSSSASELSSRAHTPALLGGSYGRVQFADRSPPSRSSDRLGDSMVRRDRFANAPRPAATRLAIIIAARKATAEGAVTEPMKGLFLPEEDEIDVVAPEGAPTREFALPTDLVPFRHLPGFEDTASTRRAMRRRYLRKLGRKYAMRQRERELKAASVMSQSMFDSSVADALGDDEDDDVDIGGGEQVFTVHVRLRTNPKAAPEDADPTLTINDVFALLGPGSREVVNVSIDAYGATDRFIEFRSKRLVKPAVAARACLTFLHEANLTQLSPPRHLQAKATAPAPPRGVRDEDGGGEDEEGIGDNDGERDASDDERAKDVDGTKTPAANSAGGVDDEEAARRRVRAAIEWAKQTSGRELTLAPDTETLPRCYDRDQCAEREVLDASCEVDEKSARRLRARYRKVARSNAKASVRAAAALQASPSAAAAEQATADRSSLLLSPSAQPADDDAAEDGADVPRAGVHWSPVQNGLDGQLPPPAASSSMFNASLPSPGDESHAVAPSPTATAPRRSASLTSSSSGSTATSDDMSGSDGQPSSYRREAAASVVQSATSDAGESAMGASTLKKSVLAGMFTFKAKKTFATHNAAAQRKQAAIEAAEEELEDARQLAEDIGLTDGAAAVVLETESDTESQSSSESDSGESIESGGSIVAELEAAGEETVVLTPRKRMEILFTKYRVNPRPAPVVEYDPSDLQRDAANLKCALCIYSRPQMYCRECGFLMCKQCSAFVHKDIQTNPDDEDRSAQVSPETKDLDASAGDETAEHKQQDGGDDNTDAAAGASESQQQQRHQPLLLAAYIRRIARERYERALAEEREVLVRREQEVLQEREEKMRRNQNRAFERMVGTGPIPGSVPPAEAEKLRRNLSKSSSDVKEGRARRRGSTKSQSADGVSVDGSSSVGEWADDDGDLFGADAGPEMDEDVAIDAASFLKTSASRAAASTKARRKSEAEAPDEAPEDPAIEHARKAAKKRAARIRRKSDASEPSTPPPEGWTDDQRRRTPAGSARTVSSSRGEDRGPDSRGGTRPSGSTSPAHQALARHVSTLPPVKQQASLLGSLAAAKKKASALNSRQVKSLQKDKSMASSVHGDKLGKSRRGGAAAAQAPALGESGPTKGVLGISDMVFEGTGHDFVDAVQDPIPQELLRYAQRLVGKAKSATGRRLAILFIVDTFHDPSLGPLENTTTLRDSWHSALSTSGYTYVTLDTTDATESYLQPTTYNVTLLVRALTETIDMPDFSLIIGIVSKGGYASLPGSASRRHFACAQDSSVLAISPTGVIMPEMLAMPDCCGNCPTVLVDAAPISYLPASGSDGCGVLWMTGRAGPTSLLAVQTPAFHFGWLAYYLQRATTGRGFSDRDGGTDLPAEELAVFLCRKLLGRGVPSIDATPPLVGIEATVPAAPYLPDEKPEDESSPFGSAATIAEQRQFAVLRSPDPVTPELLRQQKIRERDTTLRAWVTVYVLSSKQGGDSQFALMPAQWAVTFGATIHALLSGAAVGKAAIAKKKAAGAKHRQHHHGHSPHPAKRAEKPLPALATTLAPPASDPLASRVRFYLGDTSANYLKDRDRRNRLFEQVCRLVERAIDQRPIRVDLRLADGYVDVTVASPELAQRLAAEACDMTAGAATASPKASSSPSAAFKPAAVATAVVLGIDCSEKELRRLQKLQHLGSLKRFCVVQAVTADRDHTVEEQRAASLIGALVRGRAVRRRFRGIIHLVLAEIASRRELKHSRRQQMRSTLHLFHRAALDTVVGEEDNARFGIERNERLSFLKVCEVRLVEIQKREELFRDIIAKTEERARIEVLETVARLKRLANAQSSWKLILQLHQLDFRFHWGRFYIELSARRELLSMVNNMRTSDGTLIFPNDSILPMSPPPSDFDFASSFVVFPKDVRELTANLARGVTTPPCRK